MVEVTDVRAIYGGSLDDTPGPTIITYSFDDQASFDAGNTPFQGPDEFLETFQEVSAAGKALAREAFRQWGEASGLVFLEVPAGMGDVRFGVFDLSLSDRLPDSGAFAAGQTIYIREGLDDWPHLYLHEIGHAVGLKHSFEGDYVLPEELDNWEVTQMSYNAGDTDGTTLGTLDLEAIALIYGTDAEDGAHLADWDWDAATSTLTQVGFDGGQILTGVDANNIIVGGDGSDNIRIEQTIGNAEVEAGAGDDYVILANEGTSSVALGAGNDVLVVGAGERTVVDAGSGDDEVSVLVSLDRQDGDVLTLEGGEGTDSLIIFLGGNDGSAAFIFSLAGGAGSGLSISGFESVTLDGTGNADRLTAGASGATLNGYAGNDRLTGGAGDDVLSGGFGDDLLTTGGGADLVELGTPDGLEFGTDRVADFDALLDRFDLGGRQFSGVTQANGNSLLTVAGVTGTMIVEGLTGLDLAAWNELVIGAVDPREGPDPSYVLSIRDGFSGTVGGNGTVFGTNVGAEDIRIADMPGIVRLDPSFNQGGDVVRLGGNAAEYVAVRDGSSVILEHGETSVRIPVGPEGLGLVFADGMRTLVYDADDQAVRIGDQEIGEFGAPVFAQSEGAGPAIADGGVNGQAAMTSGGVAYLGGDLTVVGTRAGAETLFVEEGAQLTFDATFNEGGDRISLTGEFAEYQALRSGSSLILTAGDGTRLSIPVGVAGLELQFEDGSQTLYFDQSLGLVFIGNYLVEEADVAAVSPLVV
ncbi:hypothetical protein B5C34_05970 [Pacificimonas flava]|uniref:Peptidase metallopeptidase domain-containing protein n=2 Tax=Pacificimonas TaxID=1960290 RepID=A0A219B455_9SPHN|nr:MULTISPECIES: hypothetical protein [Pacificimonas]MBZ6377230.1 hypothetical protein [Pacificimonas aurantium]OWV33051.1 hypothetical protein B5C34_05970 [Pacificimonas flava]